MKKIYFALALTLFFALDSHSQKWNAKHLEFKNPTITKGAFFDTYRDQLLLTKDDQMIYMSSYIDNRERHHHKYHQFYKGIEVVGATYFLHEQKGTIYRSHGRLCNNINISIEPSISSEQVVQTVSRSLRNTVFPDTTFLPERIVSPTVDIPTLCIIDRNYPSHSGKNALAYACVARVKSDDIVIRRIYYIDAQTGKTIASFDKNTDTTIKSKSKSLYYGTVEIDIDSVGPNTFLLDDKSRGQGIAIKDESNNSIIKSNRKDFETTKVGQQSGIDVMYGAQHYYDMLKSRYNYNSIDNEGFQLVAYVNTPGYANAYWDGASTLYGTGDCFEYGPFTALDIVGHEFTHGLTEFNSGLVYFKESGALNEAISDIFGKALEHYTRPSTFSWILGKEIFKSASPFRSMSDPNEYESPAYYEGDYWETTASDNYGVHTNSGVLNHWFYMLVEGKEGINEAGITYDVKPFGMDKAIDLVFDLEVNYLTESSNYNDAFQFSLLSIEDDYGINSDEYDAVLEAWKAVGLTVNIFDDDIELEVYINGNAELMFVCNTNPLVLDFGFKNVSNKAIKAGTTITHSGEISGFDFTNFEIWPFENMAVTLEKDLEVDSFIYFTNPLDPDTDFSGIQISILNNIEIMDLDTTVNLSFNNAILVKEDKPLEDQITYVSPDIFIVNECSPNAYFSGIFYTLQRESCVQDTFELLLEVESDTKKQLFVVSCEPLFFYDLYFVDFKVDLIDIPSFGNIEDIKLKLFFPLAQGNKLLSTYDLRTGIAGKLPKDKIEKFSVNKPEFVEVTPCYFCSASYNTGDLTLSANTNNAPPQEDCFGPEEFYENSPLSYIQFCTNLDSYTNPVLSFNLRLSTNDVYKNAIRISQDGKYLNNPILSSTNLVTKEIKIALRKTSYSEISINSLNYEGNTYLDNIQIINDATVAIDEISGSNPAILYTNPVDQLLTVNTEFEDGYQLHFYTINGQLLMNHESVSKSTHVDMSSFQAGMYIMKIKHDQKQYPYKLIKN